MKNSFPSCASCSIVILTCFLVVFSRVAQGADADHAAKVRAQINEYLNQAFKRQEPMTLSTRLEIAFGKASDDRNLPGNSTDLVKRDAEYFLLGLMAATGDDATLKMGALGVPFYEAMKYAAIKLEGQGFDWAAKFFRSNPASPISEPGGWQWAYGGLRDGHLLNGMQKLPASTAGHGLKLRYLESDSHGKENLQKESYANSTDLQLDRQKQEIDRAESSLQIYERTRRMTLAEQEFEIEVERALRVERNMSIERQAAQDAEKRRIELHRQWAEANEADRQAESERIRLLNEKWQRTMEGQGPRHIYTMPDVGNPGPQKPTQTVPPPPPQQPQPLPPHPPVIINGPR